MAKQAMGFDAELLKLFTGFPGVISSSAELTIFREQVVPKLHIRDRFDVEKDPRFKQVIPYVVVLDPKGLVWCYRRSNKGGEERLHDQWSVGIGGHMEGQDASIGAAAFRELEEEFNFSGDSRPSTIKRVGLLYSDATPVDQVHFGAIYVTDCEGILSPRDAEIAEVKLVDIAELGELQLESWSTLVYETLLKTGKIR
jgi:predicted NUDIX family phosphoesterase